MENPYELDIYNLKREINRNLVFIKPNKTKERKNLKRKFSEISYTFKCINVYKHIYNIY